MDTASSNPNMLGPNFAKLWAGNAFTNMADGVLLAAAPLLMASLTDNPSLIAGAVFVQQLPWLLFSLLSGVYVDRLNRKTLLVLVNLTRATVIAVLGLAVWTDHASVALVYAALFLLGTAETVADNAAMSLLPAIVPDKALPNANARVFAVQLVANDFIAPPLGAALFAVALALPFGATTAAFALAAVLFAWIKAPRVVPPERRPIRTEIGEGLRFLRRHRVLRTLAITICLMNATMLAAFAILVLYAEQRLGLGEVGYGLLLASMAAGGLLGTAVASRLRSRFSDSALLRTGLLIETLTHVALALAEDEWLAGATLVVFGAHGSMWGVVSTTWRQRVVPDELRGRVNSTYLLFSVGGAAVGSGVSGPIASAFGITAPFWSSAAVMTLVLVWAWPSLGRALVDRPA